MRMRYEIVKQLKDEDIKRLTGVTRAMFEEMLAVVKAGLRESKKEWLLIGFKEVMQKGMW